MSEKDYSLIENYELKNIIGEGNFGKVKLGIFKKTGEEFAIKIIDKNIIKKKMKNILFKENEIITKFNHINVIYVFQIIEDDKNIYIVMEYCKRGELFDYIVSHQKLDEDEASIFFYQIINGVDYIHKKGISHRDLKPENILLTEDKTLKIIDFGLSHEFDGKYLLKTKCGSPSYACPEIIKGMLYDGFKCDIWCCGVILYALLCGYLPFEGNNNKELFINILKCNINYPSFLSKKSKKLIHDLLKVNPDERLTIEQIKNNDFYLKGKELCKIDYQLVENELEKRKTFHGDGEKKFKDFFKNNIHKYNNDRNIKIDKNKSRNINDINNLDNKINLNPINTDVNQNDFSDNFRHKILNKNSNLLKRIDFLENKIEQIIKIDSNEVGGTKNQNDYNNLKKNNMFNLFNYKNNNKLHLIGKQNIYNERFQNKNNGYFIGLKKNNMNSKNSHQNSPKDSYEKPKNLFTHFFSPISNKSQKDKNILSHMSNDYSRNNINHYINTETVNYNNYSNFFSPINKFNFKIKTLIKKNIQKDPIYTSLFNKNNNNEINRDIYQTNKSVDQNNIYQNFLSNSIKNNQTNDINNYYSYSENINNNQKINNSGNIYNNNVVNNINVIWKNNSDYKGKTSNKNNKKNENIKYRNDYIGLNTENKIENKKYKINYSMNKYDLKNMKTYENRNRNDFNQEILDNNQLLNYRSKSRDNAEKNITRNLKKKFGKIQNKLPPLDIRIKLNQ